MVKGLDYALLQKIRAEQARKEEEEMKMQEELLDNKAKTDRKLEAKEDLMQLRHPMAKNLNRILFEQEVPKNIDNFLEGRMAYVFELEDEYAESDIPTTLMRSKADCPDAQDNLSKSQNDIVLNKLTQILSYIRTGTVGRIFPTVANSREDTPYNRAPTLYYSPGKGTCKCLQIFR